MKLHHFSKCILLLGTAVILSACSEGTAVKTATEASGSETPKTIEKRPYKMISYETEGQTDADHLFLEEVLGWNKRSLDALKSDPRYQTFYDDALEILQSKDKIPYVSYRNGEVHNFWQDETHVRGVWRKSTLDSYLSENTAWETVLDFDKLSKDEGKNWVYKGNSCLAPNYEKCLVNLSDGGKDAVIRREFNTKTKQFIEDGFVTAESKGTISWVDADTVVVGIDFGDQDYGDEKGVSSLTDSGYPREARLWKRGSKIEDAARLGFGDAKDVGYWPGTFSIFIIQRFFISRAVKMES